MCPVMLDLARINAYKRTNVLFTFVVLLTHVSVISQLSAPRYDKEPKSNNLFKRDHKWTIPLFMPDIRADHDDQYLCMTHQTTLADQEDDQERQWIVGFKPRANSSHVHHMILYSCESPGIYQPGTPKFVWDCSSGMVHSGGVHEHATKNFNRFGPNQRNSPKKRQLNDEEETVQIGDINEESLISFERGPVCRGKEQILYAWALDAKPLKLPDKVGFKVGNAANKFLVLQVHYHYHPGQNSESLPSKEVFSSSGHFGLPFPNGGDVIKKATGLEGSITSDDLPIDNSGLLLEMQSDEISREAGILLMSSTGFVEPGLSKHEIWCQLDSDIQIHPIRFRVHTHRYGTSVMGVKLVDRSRKMSAFEKLLASMSSQRSSQQQQFPLGNNLNNRLENMRDYRLEPELIGERSPQEPETFYEVEDQKMVIGQDDFIYAACYYNQTNSWPVKIGPTSDDEMCNFYLMFWTDSQTNLSQKACSGMNPRSYVANNNNINYFPFNR